MWRPPTLTESQSRPTAVLQVLQGGRGHLYGWSAQLYLSVMTVRFPAGPKDRLDEWLLNFVLLVLVAISLLFPAVTLASRQS